MNTANCQTCKYMKQRKEGHCFMFETEPTERCFQWKGVTVGDNKFGQSDFVSALIALADREIK